MPESSLATAPADRDHASPKPASAKPQVGRSFDAAPPHPMHQLQRDIGNQAALRLLRSRSIQPKLTVGRVDDPLEYEADRVADKVMRMTEPVLIGSSPAGVQRKCTECEDEDKGTIRTQRESPMTDDSMLDADAAGRVAARSGAPLSTELRSYFEPRFGRDLSGVTVHADGEAASAARGVQARAYTLGNDIVFGAGEYAPETVQGKRLIAHELTHVVQQSGSEVAVANGQDATATQAAVQNPVEAASLQRSNGTAIVQRDYIDDAKAKGASLYQGAKETVASAVESVSQGVSSVAQTAGETVDAVAEVAGNAVQGVKEAASAAYDWASTQAGRAATALAEQIATQTGGAVRISANGIDISIGDLALMKKPYKSPLVQFPSYEAIVPLLAAGIPLGPVELAGALLANFTLTPAAAITVGPARIRNIRMHINPMTGSYSAHGELFAATAVTEEARITAGLEAAGILAGVIGDVPFALEAGIEGGLMVTLIGSAAGSLSENVTLTYADSKFSLNLNTVLQLGAILSADLDAYLETKIEEIVICEHYWPIGHWEKSEAKQYDVPIAIHPSADPPVTLGEITTKPIPFSSIETAVVRSRPKSVCKSFDDFIRELQRKGVLPDDHALQGGSLTTPISASPPNIPTTPSDGGDDQNFVPPSGSGTMPIAPATTIPYFIRQPKPLSPPDSGILIGIAQRFVPEIGKTVRLFRRPRVGNQRRFIALLVRHGFDFVGNGKLAADHVQDVEWDGFDLIENLWPLDASANSSAGASQNNQFVTFSETQGAPPKTTRITNAKSTLNGRFFVIDRIDIAPLPPLPLPVPTPTGLSESDPIPMQWFKDIDDDFIYPSPIDLV